MKTKILRRIRKKTKVLIVETDNFHKYDVFINGKYQDCWTRLNRAINYAWFQVKNRGLTNKEKKILTDRRNKIEKRKGLVYSNY